MTDSLHAADAASVGDAVRRFDLDLFLALNEEYRDKPIVARPRTFEAGELSLQADKRAKSIDGRLGGVAGKRVLEVGSGRGHLGQSLLALGADSYVGVDVVEYADWPTTKGPKLDLVRRDISTEPSDDLGQFDAIVSLAVLEHVVHPHAILEAMFQRLKPGGVLYLAANLYRGPKASHRYRQVYFPWPHLLFGDDVWRAFYRKVHGKDDTFSWVNKLTHAQYVYYFDKIGFRTRKSWVTPSTFDEAFYHRFEDQLSRYPIYDLSHDFIYALLERPEPVAKAAKPARAAAKPDTDKARVAQLEAENARLKREIDKLHASTSWQVTAPLRKLSQIRKSR
jgi:2-polyprenyl-3-methyl-5-hydroxy-6-metoxy-1,4-benzoquinol methylase